MILFVKSLPPTLERKNEDLRDEIAIRDENYRATAIQHQANADRA